MKYFLEKSHIKYKENVCIHDLTGMNQNGIIPIVSYPDSVASLLQLFNELKKRNLSFEVLGGITNTYLCNSFYRDIVIITTKMKDLTYFDSTIEVACGYNLTKLSKELSNKGIGGYEGFIGIPGTVGAAAINNSGAFNSCMSKVVKSVKLLNAETGNIEFLNNSELKYGTRTSVLKGANNIIVLSLTLDTSHHDDINIINKKIEINSLYRKKAIDGKRKSLGSIFVSTSLKPLYDNHKVAFTLKKICNFPLKHLFHSTKINTYLDFLFLGNPRLSAHCDSLNRFTWSDKTTEKDFINYIAYMQKISSNKLTLEIEIKK